MKAFKYNKKSTLDTPLDTNFSPAILAIEAFENEVKASLKYQHIFIGLKRSENDISVYQTVVFDNSSANISDNEFYLERLIKALLWTKGGYQILFKGPKALGEYLKHVYSQQGLRQFDVLFMERIYEHPFEVIILNDEDELVEIEQAKSIGKHLNGYRIGFDAGGSDRKVSAVVDGKAIFSEEVIWHPKTNSDPMYHIKGIKDSILRAASKMPRVDGIGVSSAGVYVDNQAMVASLFRQVPDDLYAKHIKNIYIDIAKDMGDIPIEVANDGDVTALAGAMSLDDNEVLGIAMGTSEAAGYVDQKGHITGWLNELAFVPVDFNQEAAIDEWSGDYGVGVSYFSQDAVIKLAPNANIHFDADLSPAEKLKVVQGLAENKHEGALEIFRTIGIYLGYGLGFYQRFYPMKHVLVLGRVTSGIGGELIIKWAKEVLKQEFSDLYKRINLQLPDEKSRRVGQSIAAASLPKIK
ncbi:transcriptional regulator [Tenericutes bacterium MZ-XQ]|nr:transcriptional regulator [Tenericutes bacterium MZ-XQ]